MDTYEVDQHQRTLEKIAPSQLEDYFEDLDRYMASVAKEHQTAWSSKPVQVEKQSNGISDRVIEILTQQDIDIPGQKALYAKSLEEMPLALLLLMRHYITDYYMINSDYEGNVILATHILNEIDGIIKKVESRQHKNPNI